MKILREKILLATKKLKELEAVKKEKEELKKENEELLKALDDFLTVSVKENTENIKSEKDNVEKDPLLDLSAKPEESTEKEDNKEQSD